MLKGILNFFKCCKPQNRNNKSPLETCNNNETVRNKYEDNKKISKSPENKSLTTKNTNIITFAMFNFEKEKNPDYKWSEDHDKNDKNLNLNNEKESILQKNDFEINSKLNEEIKNYNENNQLEQINKEIPKEKEIILNNTEIKIELKDYKYDLVKNYASNDNLIGIFEETSIAKNEEKTKENNISISYNEITKDDFDKIIVRDSYIREDERNYLTWVKFLF
jgi:hypothetical protein